MIGVAGAKDLTSVEPRPLGAELEGYAWIPRMLDKARATLAGTNGTYMFGCPVDHTCMARLGVTPELVLELAGRYGEDRDVLDALQRRGIPSAREAWFDAPAVEDELQEQDLYVRVRRPEQLPVIDGGAVFAGAEHGALVSVILLALPPGTGQPVHSHPTEEVLVAVAAGPPFSSAAIRRESSALETSRGCRRTSCTGSRTAAPPRSSACSRTGVTRSRLSPLRPVEYPNRASAVR